MRPVGVFLWNMLFAGWAVLFTICLGASLLIKLLTEGNVGATYIEAMFYGAAGVFAILNFFNVNTPGWLPPALRYPCKTNHLPPVDSEV